MNREKLIAKITEKWPVKVLSVAAAIIISIFYRMGTLETRSFLVPLLIEPNDNFLLISPVVDSVRINLREESSDIYQIREDDIQAFIDLKRYSAEGSLTVPVQIRKEGSALGIEPLEITASPIEIHLLLEEKIRREIPVFPDFSGNIQEGYEMTGQLINPPFLTAEGPRSAVENLRGFATEAVDLDRRYSDFNAFVSIINTNPLITIHGNKMIEYSANIKLIERAPEEALIEETFIGESSLNEEDISEAYGEP